MRSCETNKTELVLLDLYSGCGGMSTGLCLGAKLTVIDLVKRWALDIDDSACKSLKLNHPEAQVRNKAAEDFLELLKEWHKLCKQYAVNNKERKHPSRSVASRVETNNVGSSNYVDIPPGEYEPSHVNFGVIPIVGMGGLGKTMLAREVFNDKAVEDFKPKVWACISDDFDVLRISKALLESITGSCDLKVLDAVQVKLKNALAGKKFLLVLDDVWSVDYGRWETLKSPFMAGAVGSKIIVITRGRDVALTMGRSEYELKLLTDEACWEIFKAHVAGNRVIDAGRNSKFSHVKVVERCRGLPLAARTLGGLLRSKQRDDEWVDILDSKIWDLSYSSD